MKLIDIEGIDGTGKLTQTKLLADRLESMGFKTLWISFPSNASTASTICIDSQFGKYGNPNYSSPYARSMMYALDRWLFMNNEIDDIEQYDYIICDRYRMSNIINNLHNVSDKYDFITTLSKIEGNIPVEDFTFILDIPVHDAIKKINEREREKDLLENESSQMNFWRNVLWIQDNLSFITQTMKSPYKDYFIHVINCYSGGEMMSIGSINDIILSHIIQK